ncbi:MAG: Fic family protein [Bacilli bacterium]|nr:Fic family protein [Bacilli bacterium]
MSKIILPLEIVDRRNLRYDQNKIENIMEEIQTFLSKHPNLNKIDLMKHMLLSLEIKFNNANEGYYDDIRLIEDVVLDKEDKTKVSYNKRRRIRNLYKGYKYILTNPKINPDNLRELNKILSKNLLTKEELESMGEYYRLGKEYMFSSSDISEEPKELLDASHIERLMGDLFNFIDKSNPESNIEKYIISQIIHFYLVYIHPYYDVNGRTSRTLGIWYLLNNNASEYIIFNRAITLDKQSYYDKIRYAEEYGELTSFLIYMLENLKLELEKESIIQMIEENSKEKISDLDRQTLYSFLSNKSQSTLCDFSNFYARFNDKEKIGEVYTKMIKPLIEKDIFIQGRETQKMINGSMHNFYFGINKNIIDESNISRLSLKRKTL